MYEIKPVIFDGAKLITVFDGVDAKCFCIGYQALAKVITLHYGSLDNVIFVRQYPDDTAKEFAERIRKMQSYIKAHASEIYSDLISIACVNESSAKEYMEFALGRIEHLTDVKREAEQISW